LPQLLRLPLRLGDQERAAALGFGLKKFVFRHDGDSSLTHGEHATLKMSHARSPCFAGVFGDCGAGAVGVLPFSRGR
jgi:hypothetical protein